MAAPNLSDIYHFQSVNDNLATVTPSLVTVGEPQLLADNGLDYIHIPVVFDDPTDSDLNQFFEAMDANQGKKCFVHCIANARVSAFVLLYQVLRQGVPVEEADATMRQIWEPNPIWQAFIDKHLAQGA